MITKTISWLSAIGLISLGLAQVPALAAESCIGSECIVEFSYSGAPETWVVPAGASNIHVELYGASGGRGGEGGVVSATLIDAPETLIINVGGAGKVGSQASGGYNGGGNAGGYRTNEGSGGGATDIRLSLDLESRIAVAGGGGGAGGFSGAPGGAGGGLVAASGQSGQGSGGGGGAQTSGGNAGSSNGGTASSPGGFGFGGHGGSSPNAGGGGGGGGWFGGGGGGADDDNCCSDGGGGGGGSSYLSPTYFSDNTSAVGGNLGNGRVVITYQLPHRLLGHGSEQLDNERAHFYFETSGPVEPVSALSFELRSGDCQFEELQQSEVLISVTLSECSGDQIDLVLLADALGLGSGPATDLLVSLPFDNKPPSVSFPEPLSYIATADVELRVEVIDAITLPTASDFSVSGCALSEVDLRPDGMYLQLSSCLEGDVTVALAALSLSDQWGNLGPVEPATHWFKVDLTPPVASWEIISPTLENDAGVIVALQLSDPDQFDPGVVVIDAPEGCSFISRLELGAAIFESQCGYGKYSFTLPALSIVDPAGNQGPLSDVAITFEHLAPPEPELDEVIENSQPIAVEPIAAAPIELPDLAEIIPAPEAIEPSPNPAETIPGTEPQDLTESQVSAPALPSKEPKLIKTESTKVIEPASPASPIREIEDPAVERAIHSETEASSLASAPSGLAQTVSLEDNKSPQVMSQSFGWVWVLGLGLSLVLILFVGYRFIGK